MHYILSSAILWLCGASAGIATYVGLVLVVRLSGLADAVGPDADIGFARLMGVLASLVAWVGSMVKLSDDKAHTNAATALLAWWKSVTVKVDEEQP